MDSLLQDIRFALRTLRQNMGFTVVAVTDPLISALAAAFLAAVRLPATYLQARHATGVQPVIALRQD